MTDIQGRCPACRGDSLFLGNGGHVTCRRIDCPNPSAADDLLHASSPDAPLRDQLQAAIKALGTSETELAQLRGQLADTARSRDEWKWRAEDAKRGTRCQRERAERAEAVVARVQALVDEYPVGLDTALLEEALDQPAPAATEPPAWTPPPPGDTREQLPPAILALLPTHPYLSTACDTADAVACTATNRHPLHDELRAHAERLHARCRLNHKFTGQLCTCGCHETAPAATEATEPQEQP